MFAACDPEKPCITPGTYALLGAAAALGGIMRLTVTVVVIMFELTGALTYILPTMASFIRSRPQERVQLLTDFMDILADCIDGDQGSIRPTC